MGREDILRRLRESEQSATQKIQQAKAKAEQILLEAQDQARELLSKQQSETQLAIEKKRSQFNDEINLIRNSSLSKGKEERGRIIGASEGKTKDVSEFILNALTGKV